MRTPKEMADLLCPSNIACGNAEAAALLSAWRDECMAEAKPEAPVRCEHCGLRHGDDEGCPPMRHWAEAPASEEEEGDTAVNLIEVSSGVRLTPLRAASEALFKDITNGWVITTQNGIIDCIEEHMRSYNSSILSDLAIERQRAHHCSQRANIAEAEEQKVKDALRSAGEPLEKYMKLKARAEVAEAERDRLKAENDELDKSATERQLEIYKLREENRALRVLWCKYRDAIADIHRKDWGEDSTDYARHTEEDDCWICDLIIPIDAAFLRAGKGEA